MAFESLTEKLQNVFKNLRSKGRLTEADVKTALKEVKMALLEADVNFKVVKKFIKAVQERAVGQDVMNGLNPGQMVIKIVNDELVQMMGGETEEIPVKQGRDMTVLMMVGLQGAGKTTTAAKLAGKYKSKGKNPLLVACDVYRPAAITQLQMNGEKQGVEVFTMGDKQNPVNIAKAAIEHAKSNGQNLVIIDTAGRLHIDENMMKELADIKENVQVDATILVVDAMTGQDIVNVANTFNDELNVTGLVVTKFDGDSKGGAVLSVKSITGVPIKFVGVGEKISDLDEFHPDRLADRILGMGDVVSLVEKAQEEFDEKRSEEIARNMMSGKFTLDDMLYSIEASRKLGPLSSIMGMLPGMGDYKNMINDEDADKNLKKVKAVIQSMTPEERKDPSRLRGTHKRRIAKGSGTTVDDVNKVINQYDKMKKVMRSFSGMFRNMLN